MVLNILLIQHVNITLDVAIHTLHQKEFLSENLHEAYFVQERRFDLEHLLAFLGDLIVRTVPKN